MLYVPNYTEPLKDWPGHSGAKGVAINFVKNDDIELYYSTQIDEMPMNVRQRGGPVAANQNPVAIFQAPCRFGLVAPP
ncbi:hypothetical protein AAFF_G00222880 [Aldrovandia affinis]|uniref:Uncharacterized protein n=1 Tax=Aldrovandia affinis TaxID=143900 RepID=A0AAD7RFV1_9TELE|nr:hypothetical protein AAFF_G00222880 [Aldrovandia affinis]